MKKIWIDINSDFKCLHCSGYVSTDRFLAGVGNRNHCPYCLWSRHLDLFEAGDRLAACKAPMRPVGLTLKHNRNKYARVASGELMLIHQCSECDHFSINRVAADDVPKTIIEVFEDSLKASNGLREQLQVYRINLLGNESLDVIYRQLYGEVIGSLLEFEPTY